MSVSLWNSEIKLDYTYMYQINIQGAEFNKFISKVTLACLKVRSHDAILQSRAWKLKIYIKYTCIYIIYRTSLWLI